MNWILEILKKHTGTDGVLNTEEAMKEINSTAPKYTVPKDVYNNVANEKKNLETKVNEYETEKLTDEEKKQRILDDANAEKEKYQKMSNKLEAEKIFIAAGMTEDDYKDFIDGIVSIDADATKNLVTAMANTFKTKKEEAEEQARNDALKNNVRPDGQGGDDITDKLTQQEQIAKELGEIACKNSGGYSEYLKGE